MMIAQMVKKKTPKKILPFLLHLKMKMYLAYWCKKQKGIKKGGIFY